MSEVSLSIVLPCRNQEDHIEGVLEGYAGPLERAGRSYELVVVPNACSDRTPEIVRSVAEGDRRIRVLENPRGGWGLSVLTGLRAARGSILCYTNSARTEPEHVMAVVDLYSKSGPCLAKARREQRGAPLRETGSWLYNVEGQLLFGIRARDVNGTPKVFSRDLFRELRLFSEGDLLDLELMAKVSRRDVRIVELPITGFHRHGGRSSTGWKTAWNLYTGALRLKRILADPAA